jgi:hypothetical protein
MAIIINKNQSEMFWIKYNLHKDGSPILQAFNTEEERAQGINQYVKDGYKPIKIASDNYTHAYHLGTKHK